jgi:hypothetical protein
MEGVTVGVTDGVIVGEGVDVAASVYLIVV